MPTHFLSHYLDGQWVSGSTRSCVDVENPFTRSVVARVGLADEALVDRAVQAAAQAQAAWAQTPLTERMAYVRAFLAYLRTHQVAIAETIVSEMGAPISFASAKHVGQQLTWLEAVLTQCESLALTQKTPHATIAYEPVGVVAAITPWNYPLGQIIPKVVPALLMGNTVVLKPSEYTPLSALWVAKAFEASGLPAGVFNCVVGPGATVGAALVAHPTVRMVSFTGSTAVGLAIAQKASETLKKTSLELGGKSAFIWLPNATNLEGAAHKLWDSLLLNAGQTCTALSRLLVPKADVDRARDILLSTLQSYRQGDPTAPSTRIGPMAHLAHYERVRRYIEVGLTEGATLTCGQCPPPSPTGPLWIEPVIFENVLPTMRIHQEEIFGPVLCLMTYESEAEAIALANHTPYGLNGAVWGPRDAAQRVARQLQVGNVYINDAPKDRLAPFGGVKLSGDGREGGLEGLYAFTQSKVYYDDASF